MAIKGAQGSLDTLSVLSVADLIEDFLEKSPKIKSLHTARSYKASIRGFFGFAGIQDAAEFKPEILTPGQIGGIASDWLKSLEKRDSRDENRLLNGQTVNVKAAALSSFFDWLVFFHGYPINPLPHVHSSHKKPETSSTHSLTRSEMVDMLNHTKGKARLSEKNFRDFLLLYMGLNFALRRSEIGRLRMDDIKLNPEPIIQIYRKGGKLTEQSLSPQLMELIGVFREQYPTESPYLFRPTINRATKDLEKPLSGQSVYNVIHAVGAELFPYKNITAHSLRKTHIELHQNRGGSIQSGMNGADLSSAQMLIYYNSQDKLKNNSANDFKEVFSIDVNDFL